MLAMTGTVYGLVDPRPDQIRYVGETVQPLAVRLSGHYKRAQPRACGSGSSS